ncbi:MAG: acetyl-coenzyme A synthetase, partial [Candidatus Marinimicrobia bacterium]|nr:acetyl-coenzyme A synthetase [Candidatus Neomarinimicrobiota bacterium]
MKPTQFVRPFYKDSHRAHISTIEQYEEMYHDSVENSDVFWAKQAKRLDWLKKWDSVSNNDFNNSEIKWFEG